MAEEHLSQSTDPKTSAGADGGIQSHRLTILVARCAVDLIVRLCREAHADLSVAEQTRSCGDPQVENVTRVADVQDVAIVGNVGHALLCRFQLFFRYALRFAELEMIGDKAKST